MRNFNTRFRLRDSDRHIRLVYSFFLLLMLAGFTFSFFWAHSMTGLSPQGIANHYRGSDVTFGEPMSFRELAEITHFHLFTMPVVFMILVHVFYLTNASSRLKVITTWMSFGGVMLDLSHICANHADGRYPHDGGFSHHDDNPSLRDVGLESAAVGRKAREGRMS
jgi:hypothetical protein